MAYNYQIAKNETTISDYAQFLNAKAQADPYGLYNTSMGTDANVAGITRSGASGSYTYSVLTGSGNHPIAYVSWFDAARYANWLCGANARRYQNRHLVWDSETSGMSVDEFITSLGK